MVNSAEAAGSGIIFLATVSQIPSTGHAKTTKRNLPIPQIALNIHPNNSLLVLFGRVKEQITKSPVLAFFDPRAESEIVVDASPFGLGAVLQQRGKPIAFSSSTLTPTQRNYARIEKELLSVIYGCKKFHQYVYGTKFKIYSDHKPLIAMSKKPLAAMSSRMQRFYLQLQCYDYELFYKPGKEMFVPNTLPRAPLIKNHFPIPEEDSLVLCVLDSLPTSDIKLQEISDANKSDLVVQKLKSLLECGWDSSKGNFTGSEEYFTSDTIPESTPTVRPQEPVDERASDSQANKESSSYEPYLEV
ncbi:Retrovirus-related Pol polyprotein from transposon 297 [Araneus ventricosus]|uniref:Retrovirus-related Pol polyprotein from transposon 297 n=1 Tax=Araneus ventricosus TaxID=182803 RepID=A0A4Y2M5B1_ARAVE|nr:Retrovirus-related Pol polyprotein from transposon 297 [Araneus ventricosus]